jgi:SPP1 gp7 family putative phage head morphogenesis protein
MLPDNFWRQEDLKLYSETERMIIMLFIRGAVDAADDLKGTGVADLFNWDVINLDAVRYLQTVHKDIVHQINETTQEVVNPLISDWLKSGEPLPKLIKSIEEAGFPKYRANMIGVTEVTRAVSAGKLDAWGSTGYITTKRWTTARDERVCPICGALHGKIVSIDANFSLTAADAKSEEDLLLRYLERAGGELTYMMPPAHPNCRCDIRPVVDVAAFEDRPLVNYDE